jgi:hypothetical protein
MRQNWTRDGSACRRDGIRHDHSLWMENVPKVIHVAAMEPTL